jgi:hypothetical protein
MVMGREDDDDGEKDNSEDEGASTDDNGFKQTVGRKISEYEHKRLENIVANKMILDNIRAEFGYDKLVEEMEKKWQKKPKMREKRVGKVEEPVQQGLSSCSSTKRWESHT